MESQSDFSIENQKSKIKTPQRSSFFISLSRPFDSLQTAKSRHSPGPDPLAVGNSSPASQVGHFVNLEVFPNCQSCLAENPLGRFSGTLLWSRLFPITSAGANQQFLTVARPFVGRMVRVFGESSRPQGPGLQVVELMFRTRPGRVRPRSPIHSTGFQDHSCLGSRTRLCFWPSC